jgi:hypothetical protein
MKLQSIIYLISLLLIAQQATAQQMIQKMFYSQYIDLPGRIMQASNGDYLFTNERATSTQVFSTTISRLDSNLNLLWTKEYNYPGYIVNYLTIHEIAPDTFITWGGINISNGGNLAQFLLKIDGNGQVISSKMLFGLNNFYVKDIVWSNEQQRLVLYGKKVIAQNLDERMQMLAYDGDFNFLWGKEYRYSQFVEAIASAAFYGSNGLIVQASSLGYQFDTLSTDPRDNVLLFRVDSTGNVMWQKRLGNIPNLYPGYGFNDTGGLLIQQDGNIINAFTTNYFVQSPFFDVIVQKTDSLGNEINAIRIGDNATQYDYFYQVMEASNRNIVIRAKTLFNVILNENLNYIDVKIMGLLGNQIYITDEIATTKNNFVAISTTVPGKKIVLLSTDSSLNVGCNQFNFVPYPTQPVSFPNTFLFSSITDSAVFVSDSSIVLQAANTFLNDSLLCSTSLALSENVNSGLEVYPTVFTQGVFIKKNNFNETITYTIFDLYGKKIKIISTSSSFLDFSFLSNGLYVLRCSLHNQSFNFKIIKQ